MHFQNKIKSTLALQVTLPKVAALVAFSTLFLGIQPLAYGQNILPGAVEPEREVPILPEAVEDDIVTVPSAGARPVDLDAGPKINVKEFVVVYDDETLIAANQRSNVKTITADYLNINGNELSLAQLEDVAFLLTQYFRQSGFMLAQAILPAQEVEKGSILMRVYVGKLGSVASADNNLYSNKIVQRRFHRHIGDAVSVESVESNILRLNDMPGFSSVAQFKAGENVGETRLTVKAVEEDPVSYFASIDNHGVESTGDVRLLLGVDINNVTGHIDRLSIDGVKTFNPGDLRNARINYEITHPDLVHTLGLSFSETRYDVEGAGRAIKDNGIHGDTEIGQFYLDSQWIRQRNINVATRVGLALKRADVEFQAFNSEQGVDRLTVLEVGIVADAVDTRFRGIHRASLTFSHGFNDTFGSMDGVGNGQSLGRVNGDQALAGQFNKINASYSRLQSLVRNQSLLFRFNGQHSDDMLSSLEKMSLGGPYTVRAYPVAEYVRDTAVFTSLAWVLNGAALSNAIAYDDYTWGDIFSVSLFADYGWGKLKDGAGGPNDKVDISGWGAEAEFTFPNVNTYARLAVARPFDSSEASNGEEFQYWVSLGVNF